MSVLNPNGYLESRSNNGLSVSTSAESFTKNYIAKSTEHGEIGDYYSKYDGTINGVTSSGGTVTIDTFTDCRRRLQAVFRHNINQNQ